MAILDEQAQLFEELERSWSNYNKDGKDRKSNPDYYKKQWSKLEELWQSFERNHNKICMIISQEEPYFVERCYDKAREIYLSYQQSIKLAYEKLTTAVGGNPGGSRVGQGDNGDPKTQQTGNYSKLDESLRKQESNFRAFARTVNNIHVDNISEKWEFEDALKTIEARWNAIDSLHWEIDSELNGRDLAYEATCSKYEEQFNTLKKDINRKMWSVSYKEKFTPKLDIPIFSGNFNNWVSFKDLFVDAIHNNITMPNSQKMQVLKSKLRGEPERLVQHLSISSDNYMSCWDILNHRYNNMKQIFNAHMNIIFGLPNIQRNSVNQIKRMHDVTIETLNAVKNLGVDILTWDPILVHLLAQKLDTETYNEYLETIKKPRDLPVLKELLDFLESKFTNLETLSRRKLEAAPQKQNFQHESKTYSTNSRKFTQNYNNTKNSGNWHVAKSYNVTSFTCPMCKNEHGIYNCRAFLQLPNDKKLQTVNKLGFCINCLFSHNGKPCNSTKTCRKCPGQHNSILHEALAKSVPKPSTSGLGNNAISSRDHVTSTSHVSQENYSEILLATAQLKVLGANGTLYTMRALVDQGSQISIITEHAAQILGLKRERCKGVIFGVGQQENSCKGKLNINCSSMYNDFTFKAEVIIMNNLIKNLPNKTFQKPSWNNIQNINLADPEFFISRPVDLLLGADIYSNIILSGMIKGDDAKQPIAQQTQLGWILCGNAQTFHCNVVINNIEDIQQFWEVEDITEEGDLSSEEIQCVKYFQETTTRNEEGRYEVRLPMKSNFEEQLGTSKHKALAQFRNLEQRLNKHEQLATSYRSFMNEYLTLKHMKVVDSNSKLECYLPHHGVERAESTTTKYRVVFNASSKTSTGCSLNDLMYKGPNLQQDLQCLLLRWRQYRYAFTADIEKMYRQILVNIADTPLQKIIWRESPEQPIQSFELATVTYGTKAAPFLAMMTLKRLAADERNSFPVAAKVLEESFYMDDLVHGAHNIEEGKKLINDLNLLLKSGGFNLRKWSSNSKELIENIPEQHSDNMMFNFKTENTSKTLGLCWNPVEDYFTFKCHISNPTKLTRRSLLSEISKDQNVGILTPTFNVKRC